MKDDGDLDYIFAQEEYQHHINGVNGNIKPVFSSLPYFKKFEEKSNRGTEIRCNPNADGYNQKNQDVCQHYFFNKNGKLICDGCNKEASEVDINKHHLSNCAIDLINSKA